MAKLFVLIFVWGPAFLGFSLGWLVAHPDDWSGPAVIAPVAGVITAITYRWGVRRQRSLSPEVRPLFVAAMVASALVGVVLFVVFATGTLR